MFYYSVINIFMRYMLSFDVSRCDLHVSPVICVHSFIFMRLHTQFYLASSWFMMAPFKYFSKNTQTSSHISG